MDNYGNPKRRLAHGRRRKKQLQINPLIIALVAMILIVMIAIAAILYFFVVKPTNHGVVPTVETTQSGAPTGETETEETKTEYTGDYAIILQDASVKAAMYDYDGAISYIKEMVPSYEQHKELTDFISSCLAKKNKLVKWADNTKITHIFFHILVYDEQTAFAPSNYEHDDYNQVMTTVGEFKKIIEAMYEEGYVLVRLSDIASIQKDANGNEKMVYNPIYLPEGKTPFVLSQDDVCYYEYMLEAGQYVKSSERGDTYTGYATKLVLDENGKVINEMKMADGSYTYGAFDMVPILDEFIEEHPDFSYHGAKGILALTGYNGIFGYRTSYITYGVGDTTWPSAHKSDKENANIEEDRATCVKIANALRESGWEFASHTWGHMDMTDFSATGPTERFWRDTDWWQTEVAPLIGGTDIMIYAYGGDVGTWRTYSADNEMYRYLKEKGFNYFCNVDASTHYWVQMVSSVKSEDGSYADSGYFRQGRRNVDGQRMLEDILYPEKNRLSDLFNSKEIFSENRPLPEKGTESYIGVKLPATYDPDTLLK